LRSAFELMGCEVEFSGAYPGWTPNAQSKFWLLCQYTRNKTR
jgi:di/tripeptidase